MPSRSPHLFIISAPSGAGKTTLCRRVHEQYPDMHYSVSYTSRNPRKSEQEGIDYHFIDRNEFENLINRGRWAEWALVYGNYYGTSADFLDAGLRAGKDVLLDLDVQGTRQLLERYAECVAIFIRPPSIEALRQRLEKRGTDSAETIAVRLDHAEKEMAQQDIYQHVIVNDELAAALVQLISIIEQYRT